MTMSQEQREEYLERLDTARDYLKEQPEAKHSEVDKHVRAIHGKGINWATYYKAKGEEPPKKKGRRRMAQDARERYDCAVAYLFDNPDATQAEVSGHVKSIHGTGIGVPTIHKARKAARRMTKPPAKAKPSKRKSVPKAKKLDVNAAIELLLEEYPDCSFIRIYRDADGEPTDIVVEDSAGTKFAL